MSTISLSLPKPHHLIAVAFAATLLGACETRPGSQGQNQTDASCVGAYVDVYGYCRLPNGQFATSTCCEEPTCLFGDGVDATLDEEHVVARDGVFVEADTELTAVEREQVLVAASDVVGSVSTIDEAVARTVLLELVRLDERDGWRNYHMVFVDTDDDTHATLFGVGSTVPVAWGNSATYDACHAEPGLAWDCLDLADDVSDRCLPDDDGPVDWAWCLGSTVHGDATELAGACCESGGDYLWCAPPSWTCSELEDYVMDVCLPDDGVDPDFPGCFASTPVGDQTTLANACCEVSPDAYVWCGL